MSQIKDIYSFTIQKKVKREITEENGDTKVIKTIEQQEPVKIIFKNPSRGEREDADMIFAVEYGKCVRAGVLTSPLIEKLYDEKEKSGILSDDFADKYLKLYERFFEIQNEFTSLDLKDNKTPEEENRIAQVAVEFSRIKNDLQNLESARNSLFQNTAETKAQNKTILWLTLFLTYSQEGNQNPKPFFKGSSFEEKLEDYDQLIENGDEFTFKVIDKMAFFVALWYMRKASTKEDFSQIEKDLNSDVNLQESNKPEEVKSDDTPIAAEPATEVTSEEAPQNQEVPEVHTQ